MEVLFFALIGIVVGLVGLVRLWQRQPASTALLVGAGVLILAGLVGFTAELWFEWLGRSRGDGQVFIGYFLFGAGAFLGALGIGVLAAIVAALRPKTATTDNMSSLER